MPLPHFLVLIAAIAIAAALTIWLAIIAQLPLGLMGLIAVVAAGGLHLAARQHRQGDKPD